MLFRGFLTVPNPNTVAADEIEPDKKKQKPAGYFGGRSTTPPESGKSFEVSLTTIGFLTQQQPMKSNLMSSWTPRW